MIVYAVEPLPDCWDEMIALASEHWKETEGYRHSQPFAPDFNRYNQYAAAGWYFEGTVRDDGVLVGYCGMYLVPSMHSQCQIAVEDSLFLAKSHRSGRTAMRFIQFLEEECRRRGAVEVEVTAKTEPARRLLEFLDFKQVSTHHVKQLSQPVRADSPIQPPSGEEHVGVQSSPAPSR